MMNLSKSMTKIILGSIFLIAGCSSDPKVKEQGSVKEIPDGYTAVSICHTGEPEDKDMVMNSCPVTKRVRTTFLCTQ